MLSNPFTRFGISPESAPPKQAFEFEGLLLRAMPILAARTLREILSASKKLGPLLRQAAEDMVMESAQTPGDRVATTTTVLRYYFAHHDVAQADLLSDATQAEVYAVAAVSMVTNACWPPEPYEVKVKPIYAEKNETTLVRAMTDVRQESIDTTPTSAIEAIGNAERLENEQLARSEQTSDAGKIGHKTINKFKCDFIRHFKAGSYSNKSEAARSFYRKHSKDLPANKKLKNPARTLTDALRNFDNGTFHCDDLKK